MLVFNWCLRLWIGTERAWLPTRGDGGADRARAGTRPDQKAEAQSSSRVGLNRLFTLDTTSSQYRQHSGLTAALPALYLLTSPARADSPDMAASTTTPSQLPRQLSAEQNSTANDSRTAGYTIELSTEEYDAEQIILMEERLILLDNDDKNIGEGSKKDCKQIHSLIHSHSIPSTPGGSPSCPLPPPRSLLALAPRRPPHPSTLNRGVTLPSPPRVLRVPVPPRVGQAAAPEARGREDHVPEDVDKHVLLAPAHERGRDGGGGAGW